jgi:uncharacterized GH25 family protein
MKLSSFKRATAVIALSLAFGASLPLTAHAHRAWMLPSTTVLSGSDQWVTVDAAISTDLFYADHNPMRLDNLEVFAPDGSKQAPENPNTGKYRSTFDVKLSQKGTYKFAVVSDSINASYKIGGETKRWRGSADALRKELPADATDVSVTRAQSRLEVFVTAGKPSDKVLQPTGAGLELVPITHPNDLVAGDTGSFKLLLDGKPAAGVEVVVIPGGVRYRGNLADMRVTTDADGKFAVKWPQPGMYWINASTGSGGAQGMGGGMAPGSGAGPGSAQGAGAGAGAGSGAGPSTGQPGPRAGGTIASPARRTSYSATFEVLQN